MTWFFTLTQGQPSEEAQHHAVDDEGLLAPPSPRFRGSMDLDNPDHGVLVCPGDPWGQALEICHGQNPDACLPLHHLDPETQTTAWGAALHGFYAATEAGFCGAAVAPCGVDLEAGKVLCDDPLLLAQSLAPEAFEGQEHPQRLEQVQLLYRRFYGLGLLSHQGLYEDAHQALARQLRDLDALLSGQRFLTGAEPRFADTLLFACLLRMDPVYYELYKASVGLLSEFPALWGFVRDLYEGAAYASSADWQAIKAHHYLCHPLLNPRGLLPKGGLPELDLPHDRDIAFAQKHDAAGAIGEDQSKRRGKGEWVRPDSLHRHWIQPDPEARYPAEAGRYHLYAPYNCPWSHRALLARSVKGLEDVVGASIAYFRRDPEEGWQFNPAIPGCTEDRLYGHRYVVRLYQAVGSQERSVPVLWDAVSETIVSNESAEILRMFNGAFGDLARHAALDLYPEAHRPAIDRLNEQIYQRINNGAYKAGFARSQEAYERAYDRYFAMLHWLEQRLSEAQTPFLLPTEAPTEADLRLFPTIYRHDAVYYSRFKLNQCRIQELPQLSAWLERMLQWPGVNEASHMDHSRNGYFGRTGNGVVPAGPTPLGLSPRDYPHHIWMNQEHEQH